MPGINQLPAGSEFAAAISLTWASTSWLCSILLLWLTWSHHEGWSYLALLSISSLVSNTFSIIQQGRDITWWTDTITEQWLRKQKLPADDPELAIAAGSYGVDLVLFYLQYYSYNVQAMLVMFWAAELCQLTYHVGEHRRIRHIFRKVHVAGKYIAWLLPMITILCLRDPSLRQNFVAFILVADLPLMISLAISSALMIAVTLKYVQSRQKFTQWSPPKFNSANSSEAGLSSQNSSRVTNSTGNKGLYDRWLLVRFTIAFVLLAVFEVTNALFQVTALKSNIQDAKSPAPDLSAGRAIQVLFLFMPGTTPGIFLYIVFGTTTASRRKVAALLLPKQWREPQPQGSRGCCSCLGRSRGPPDQSAAPPGGGGIIVERSLVITSASRIRASQMYGEEDFSDPSEISLSEIPKRSHSVASVQSSNVKPLPMAPRMPTSKFRTPVGQSPSRSPQEMTSSVIVGLSAIREKKSVDSESASRTDTQESLQVPDDYQRMGPEHSDDSGPILPIQRPEVRFSTRIDVLDAARGGPGLSRQSKNFSRPRK